MGDQSPERVRRIGGRIRAMRLAAGRTPAALAAKVGAPQQVVAAREAGKIEPRSDWIVYVAVAPGRLTTYPPRVILPSAAIHRTPDEGQVRHGS